MSGAEGPVLLLASPCATLDKPLTFPGLSFLTGLKWATEPSFPTSWGYGENRRDRGFRATPP